MNAVVSFVLIAAAVYFAVVVPMNALAARRNRGAGAARSDHEEVRRVPERSADRGAAMRVLHVADADLGSVARPRAAPSRLYRQLLLETRPYWPHILLLAFVNLLATPIALLTPVPLKIAVDSIAGSAPASRLLSGASSRDALEMSVTGLVVFTAVR